MKCTLFILLMYFILCITTAYTDTPIQQQMVCPNKFQPVGRFCYHFSDDTKNWKHAHKACKKMTDVSNNLNVMLATLDVTGVTQDNQDLLSEIRDYGNKYWLGGHLKSEGDNAQWQWVDNRPIQLTSNYWRENSPNNTEGHECLEVSTHSKDTDSKKLHTRASVINKDCSKLYRYVCQAACPIGFQLIGKYCYFFSSENEIAGVNWDDARKFCQAKSADLAVMGLDTANDQTMLDIIANTGKKMYMGASDRTKDNSWFWLDGRPLPLDSYFWDASAPQPSDTHNVLVAKVISSPGGEVRAVLEDATSDEVRHFICQLLYTPPFGQMFTPVAQINGQKMVQTNEQEQSKLEGWQSDLASDDIVQAVASNSTEGQVQTDPVDQTQQSLPALPVAPITQNISDASTLSNTEVEDLLQAIINEENAIEEKAAFVEKKIVKKETDGVYGTKDLNNIYDTHDTYDSYDSYDTGHTGFNYL